VIRVLVADDHVFYREGVKSMLDGHRRIAVVAEATTGEEAVHRAAVAQPDVVLMDRRMPGTGGIEATRRITAAQPGVAVLVLTMFDDDSVFAAMRAGARGYLLKHATLDDLIRAITAVHHGEAIFSPTTAERLLRFVTSAPVHRGAAVLPELTQRERDVLYLVALGRDNRQIAAELDLTPKTVRNYVSGVLTKLQVHDRAAAVAKAREAGFGPPPP
jgi:DNA-binding NarL/FixJ family response regulator